jgi:hypothetical protein
MMHYEDYNLWPPSHCGFFTKLAPPVIDGQQQYWGKFQPSLNETQWKYYHNVLKLPVALKFENYASEVGSFLEAHGIKHDKNQLYQKINSTTHDHYSHYYNENGILYIAIMAALDTQLFNYSFEDVTGAPIGLPARMIDFRYEDEDEYHITHRDQQYVSFEGIRVYPEIRELKPEEKQ